MHKKQKIIYLIIMFAAAVLIGVFILYARRAQISREEHRSTSFAMDTIVSQTAYGENAEAAMAAVNKALLEYDAALSMYNNGSEIAKINENAGIAPVAVSEEAYNLIKKAVSLSSQSDNAFAVTIEPISLAWGITSDTPRVLTQAETDALMPLVDDENIVFDDAAHTVFLPQKGQGIDLGGIAKGAACELIKGIYEEYGVDSAIISIGGNVYAKGVKPDGSAFTVGFRDPDNEAVASVATVKLTNAVMAVSGGYERYFEADGKRYIHIFNPETGYPAESDILSVGVINEDGAAADFYSTVLYVWGKDKALQYLSEEGTGMLLDAENNLYVSKSLESVFELRESEYNVIFI